MKTVATITKQFTTMIKDLEDLVNKQAGIIKKHNDRINTLSMKKHIAEAEVLKAEAVKKNIQSVLGV